ncbi:dehydrogenase/reductase SDR family protein 7-like [Patiria miniata]|uniref:Dehydrogenase/reductase SDR family member 7B n=1 Tax=Patiria miniata TaxID=46514 RepID=A0A914AKI1_PATMI|nr:dehydrogenase/reductase SDR family protein 7-like [Patiria miniata]XP_038064237.1 dehydrogenase/reductase SDR family protein 7-like [Patiria miniata]XP_038064238.1 dehydrogenase/reductase SDR family protein 7-like [Patiria miniata]XP_038064239.1 dehydrogenase/reductase SDR family protein 7-like [Patiria miniata]XP_038064240.1 dehydrogenase/reductase SDR family protein 7-like [Patiria miniata]XP_038064241.1 dehydrogenase/reductase SDR family protein 7-like [Patiria miniata]
MDRLNITQLQIAAGLTFGSLGLLWLWRQLTLRRGRALFKDKVVLITGASSGLGEACAHAFYREGSKVILCARRVKELERVRNDLSSLKLPIPTHSPCILTLDLEDLQTIPKKAEEALALHGRVDILVNNGGMGYRGTVVGTEMSVHQKLMNVNYFGSVALTKELLPSMIAERSGHIVAVSSVQGKIAIPYRSAYAASKHAMNAFFDSLRAEVAQHNVCVTVVSPSYIKTNISYNAVTADGMRHGELDHAIATGMTTDYVVKEILAAMIRKQSDLVLGPVHHRLAIYLRVFSPWLYAWIMSRRALGGED